MYIRRKMICRVPNRERCATGIDGKIIALFDAATVITNKYGSEWSCSADTPKMEIIWCKELKSAYLRETQNVGITDCYKISLAEAVIILTSFYINEAEFEMEKLPTWTKALKQTIGLVSSETGAMQSVLFSNALSIAEKYKVRDFRDIYYANPTCPKINNISLECLPVRNVDSCSVIIRQEHNLITDPLSSIKLISQQKIKDMVCCWLTSKSLSDSDELALKAILCNITIPDFLYHSFFLEIILMIQNEGNINFRKLCEADRRFAKIMEERRILNL